MRAMNTVGFPVYRRSHPCAPQVPPDIMHKPNEDGYYLCYRYHNWGHRDGTGPHVHFEAVPEESMEQYGHTGQAPGVIPLDAEGNPTHLAGSAEAFQWEDYPSAPDSDRQTQLAALLGAVRRQLHQLTLEEAGQLQERLQSSDPPEMFYLTWLLLETAPASPHLIKFAWATLMEPLAVGRAEAASYLLRTDPSAEVALGEKFRDDLDPYLRYELGLPLSGYIPVELVEILELDREEELPEDHPIRQARQQVEARPTAGGWSDLGAMCLQQGEFLEAREAYRQSLALEPDHYSSLYGLGIACIMLDFNEEALPVLRRANQLNPADSRPWSKLGTLALRAEDYPNAIVYFRKALELKRDEVDLSNLGLAYEACGRHREAQEAFRQALDIDPDFLPARMNLASKHPG